jgi:hypothetical protein
LNYHTGNIHRGSMQFTGRALVTLGLAAAFAACNLRELENWHAQVSKRCRDNPLLGVYEQHPLHQPAQWVHGLTMFNQEQRGSTRSSALSGNASGSPRPSCPVTRPTCPPRVARHHYEGPDLPVGLRVAFAALHSAVQVNASG